MTMMKKIDVLIIGAQKAGTTSLKNYLAQHEKINTHEVIEFPFFKDIEVYNKGYSKIFNKYFSSTSDGDLLLAKSAAMYYDAEALKRVKEHNPNCKLILSLREPVSRTISAYKMEKFNGGFDYEMKDIIDSIKKREYKNVLYRVFIEQSLYGNHVSRIFEIFSKDQILIVDYHFLSKNAQQQCEIIWEWLGIELGTKINADIIHNQTKAPRSQAISNILIRLRNEKSLIKRLARAILPYKIFTKIGMFLTSLNKSNKESINISAEETEFLKTYYQSSNELLKNQVGINFSDSEYFK